MPSGQEYVNRLREDAQRTLAPQVNDLEKELNNIKSDLTVSLGQLSEKLEAVRNFALPEAESVVLDALEEAARERRLQFESLARFSHDIRAKETQEEILNSLLDEAAKFSPQVALFVIRGGNFAGWSSRGFSQRIAEEIGKRTLQRSANALVEKALGSDRPTSVSDITQVNELEFLREEGAGPWQLFPMKAVGRPVALLLTAGAGVPAAGFESISMLLDLTGMCIENIALKVLHDVRPQVSAAKSEKISPQVPGPSELHVAAVEAPPATPGERLAARVTAEKYIPPSSEQMPSEEPVERESAESTPPTPAPEPVQQPEVRQEQPPGAHSEPEAPQEGSVAVHEEQAAIAAAIGGGWVQDTPREQEPAPEPMSAATQPAGPAEPAEKTEPQPVDEEKADSAAKRFARLLVSEIKLYNEQRVIDGRQNRDVYVRLKKDIDKSREMYEKRVPPFVTRKNDYFHDEVIRILGENDPSALGSDYPGPRVES
ncbi:MAG TPA: hypothetical protein VE398_12950 [Acidobacteriota bacterium]|nr:hypothetical protein [Acidobacteriota bacterium]